MTTAPGVAITGLESSYGTTRVLRRLDLVVARGDVACVLGPSGCGKTTLLRVLAGFLPAEAGTVSIGGRVVDDGRHCVAPEDRRVGYVPQEGALFPHLTVAGNVGFALARRSRRQRALRRGRVDEMLELVGLAGYGHRRPDELSGGQQQRVALARALICEPDLVLLDEPFAALDASLRHRLRLDVRAALAAAGVTAILVTHDQTEALSLGDQVVLMRDGKALQSGSPVDLYTHPSDAWSARFVGDATLLAADIHDGIAHTPLGALAVAAFEDAPAGAARVVIRPEQIVLAGCPPVHMNGNGAGNGNGLPPRGEVTKTHYYGHDALVEVALLPARTHTVMARTWGPVGPPAPGTEVMIRVEGPVQAVGAEA
ncbi:MAG TPA: ABC transporter ATP-binding protein [Actinomycetota bacterium]|nr:ABC transporter ATP-binding protein [Actinomycetota bacterium]